MNDEQRIVILVVGLIVLVLVIKLWRVVLGIGVVGAIALFVLCQSGKIPCPIDHGFKWKDSGDSFTPNLTEDRAIGQVRTYLVRVSSSTPQPKPDCYNKPRDCKDWDLRDLQKPECKKDPNYPTKPRRTSEWVCEPKGEQSRGPCVNPPQGGQWTAQYNSSTRSWSVFNYWQHRRYGWTVQDRSGEVLSHQPPC